MPYIWPTVAVKHGLSDFFLELTILYQIYDDYCFDHPFAISRNCYSLHDIFPVEGVKESS